MIFTLLFKLRQVAQLAKDTVVLIDTLEDVYLRAARYAVDDPGLHSAIEKAQSQGVELKIMWHRLLRKR
jgi:hypothetical protein